MSRKLYPGEMCSTSSEYGSDWVYQDNVVIGLNTKIERLDNTPVTYDCPYCGTVQNYEKALDNHRCLSCGAPFKGKVDPTLQIIKSRDGINEDYDESGKFEYWKNREHEEEPKRWWQFWRRD